MKSRQILTSVIGNLLTNYETALFGWIAPILAPLLFPGQSPSQQLLYTFALLPLSYLAKPVGALFWGRLGDRFGRKIVLMFTLFGCALATLGMALLPVGPWMVSGFLFCKSLQKFCYAGEKKGGAIYLLEHAKGSRTFWSSFYDASGVAGIFLAALLVQLLGKEYWRLLFLAGSSLALVGLTLRLRGAESPEFQPSHFSFRELFRERGVLFRIILASGFSYLNYNLITVFLNGYLPLISRVTLEEALWINTHLLWLDVALLLFFGWLTTKIDATRLMQKAALLIALFAMPLMALLRDAGFYEVLFIRLFFIAMGVAFAAPYHAWAYETAPKGHRFLFGSLGSSLGGALFGSTAPLLASLLTQWQPHPFIIGAPLLLVGSFAALSLRPKHLHTKVIINKYSY
jgi:MFS family permease